MALADFNIWYKSFSESFLYINERSNLKDDLLDYSCVLKGQYKDSIIKPINKYVEHLYPKPKLVSCENNKIILEYLSFAEIMLLKRSGDKVLSAMEKVHMRQFYLSDQRNDADLGCFPEVYRVFIPWFVDIPDTLITVTTIEDSAFKVFPKWLKLQNYSSSDRIDPEMLYFQFRNTGAHMIDEEYGKIKRSMPMFRIEFNASDTIVEKVREFYAKG